jgi:hypothetical protein
MNIGKSLINFGLYRHIVNLIIFCIIFNQMGCESVYDGYLRKRMQYINERVIPKNEALEIVKKWYPESYDSYSEEVSWNTEIISIDEMKLVVLTHSRELKLLIPWHSSKTETTRFGKTITYSSTFQKGSTIYSQRITLNFSDVINIRASPRHLSEEALHLDLKDGSTFRFQNNPPKTYVSLGFNYSEDDGRNIFELQRALLPLCPNAKFEFPE